MDEFKSAIIISLDEIIEQKLANKIDDKFKEFNNAMRLHMVDFKTQINFEMES